MDRLLPLDALDGIAWIVDAGGVLVDYGRTNWNEFASANDGGELAAENSCVGMALADIVRGNEVLDRYLAFLDALRSGRTRQVVFVYRCDGPGIGRDMRMAITTVPRGGHAHRFLFQSVMLSARLRPSLPLYDFKGHLGLNVIRGDLPILAMCSFCQRVRSRDAEAEVWISGEDYYRGGGYPAVSISHTLCPDCVKTTALRAGDGG